MVLLSNTQYGTFDLNWQHRQWKSLNIVSRNRTSRRCEGPGSELILFVQSRVDASPRGSGIALEGVNKLVSVDAFASR